MCLGYLIDLVFRGVDSPSSLDSLGEGPSVAFHPLPILVFLALPGVGVEGVNEGVVAVAVTVVGASK